MEDLKEWLIPISTFITLISTSIGILLSLKQYRLKVQAEIRLKESARAETDIRLLQLFTEILTTATARKGEPILVEKVIEELFQKEILNLKDLSDANVNHVREKLSELALLQPLLGASSMTAAFASIATLANRHEVLRAPAIQALETFRDWQPELSEKYLKEIG